MDLEALSKELEIKAATIVEGISIDLPALEGVGSRYNEDISAIFGYYMRDLPPGSCFPRDFRLPLGTLVKVSYNPRSQYSVRKDNGSLVLEKSGKFISTVEWVDRPKFLEKETSDGVKMKMVAQLQADCALMVCVNNFCTNWADGLECRYCNMNPAHQARDKQVLTTKKNCQIGEVAAEVLKEGYNLHLVLSGGFLPEEKATDAYIKVLEAIKEHTGLEEVYGCANLPVPKDLKKVEKLYKAGFKSVLYDLEVWNPDMFKAICPGKAKKVGRDNWLRALEYAATLFQPGTVICGFVQGLEEKNNYYEAAEYLAERGVVTLLIPWVPMQGSKLEGHRAPYGEWIYEVNEKVFEIINHHIPQITTEEYFYKSGVPCYRCGSVFLYADQVRRAVGGKEFPMPRDKQSPSSTDIQEKN